jgi:hypothetical protein
MSFHKKSQGDTHGNGNQQNEGKMVQHVPARDASHVLGQQIQAADDLPQISMSTLTPLANERLPSASQTSFAKSGSWFR